MTTTLSAVDAARLFDVLRTIKRGALASAGMAPALAAKAGLTQSEVDAVHSALDGRTIEPPWTIAARQDIGLKEIPGKAHAPRILQMLRLIKAPFTDDETPWCGSAMAAWFTQVGIQPPPNPWRALEWATWGVPCPPQVGAIGVKSRTGGNHVFQIVGVTDDGLYFKALGANQSNAVTVMDIARKDAFAVRWPAGVPQPLIPLPNMRAGTISRSEA